MGGDMACDFMEYRMEIQSDPDMSASDLSHEIADYPFSRLQRIGFNMMVQKEKQYLWLNTVSINAIFVEKYSNEMNYYEVKQWIDNREKVLVRARENRVKEDGRDVDQYFV